MHSIDKSFNRAALSYDNFSYPQQIIGEHLISIVTDCSSNCKIIADLGCGTGFITNKLINAINYEKLVAVDISETCLELAKQNIPDDAIICFDNINNITQYGMKYNLIFANMSLHWCENINATLSILKNNLADNGMVAFSIPLSGTFNELNEKSKNQFYKINSIHNNLLSVGIKLLMSEEKQWVFNYPTWLQALKSIKSTGTNYVFNRSHRGLTGAKNFQSKRFFKDNLDLYTLTYQIGFFLGINA